MIDWINRLRGYLRVKITGFSPERFFNLCGSRGIVLWDIRQTGEGYELCIGLRDFYRLRPIVRKTRTRVVILKRYGLPFFVPLLRSRKLFLAGAVLAAAFLIWSSGRIWDIQYTGNYQITEDMMEDFLDGQHIFVGMPKEDLDIEQMEKEIRKAFPRITWTSARLSGTRLLIDIKEDDMMPVAEEDAPEGCDLVSAYDGTVVAMVVRTGTPKVHIGDEVLAGDVLVEGRIPIYNEDGTFKNVHIVQADADIVVEHVQHFEESLPACYTAKEYTGRDRQDYFLRLGKREMRSPGKPSFLQFDSVISLSRPLFLEKLSIPLYWGSYTHREYQNVEHRYTTEEAESLLEEKLDRFLLTLEEKGVQILEKDVKIDTDGMDWILTGDFLVEESAGLQAAIENNGMGETETDE